MTDFSCNRLLGIRPTVRAYMQAMGGRIRMESNQAGKETGEQQPKKERQGECYGERCGMPWLLHSREGRV